MDEDCIKIYLKSDGQILLVQKYFKRLSGISLHRQEYSDRASSAERCDLDTSNLNQIFQFK